jgi:hypothetical protein
MSAGGNSWCPVPTSEIRSPGLLLLKRGPDRDLSVHSVLDTERFWLAQMTFNQQLDENSVSPGQKKKKTLDPKSRILQPAPMNCWTPVVK